MLQCLLYDIVHLLWYRFSGIPGVTYRFRGYLIRHLRNSWYGACVSRKVLHFASVTLIPLSRAAK